MLNKALAADECSEASALDLQARMHAQQGRYLDAETCWERAKRLDGSNPVYDEAIGRLRSPLRPASRLVRAGSLLSGAGVLLVLAWQVLVVTPTLASRQEARASALTAVSADVERLRNGLADRDRGVAASIEELDDRLGEIAAGLSLLQATVPTASQIAEGHAVAIAPTNEEVARLRVTLGQDMRALYARHARTDSLRWVGFTSALGDALLERAP